MVLVYLSGPIIISENRRDDFYKAVINFLELFNFEVFAPQFLPHAEPSEIYRRDVESVRKADFIIAEISSPSHGVGMEIMLGIELGKPLLLFHHRAVDKISKMVTGADGIAIFDYQEPGEVVAILRSINLHELVVLRCSSCSSQVAAIAQGSP
ncbi:MAG: nucleoside 2-deoxyribosyltransferase, partial [Promethearchaeota archaeon]